MRSYCLLHDRENSHFVVGHTLKELSTDPESDDEVTRGMNTLHSHGWCFY